MNLLSVTDFATVSGMDNQTNNSEALRTYFTTLSLALDAATIQNQAMVEALKLLVPGFEAEFRKQTLMVEKMRQSGKQQEPHPAFPSQVDQLIAALQNLSLGRK